MNKENTCSHSFYHTAALTQSKISEYQKIIEQKIGLRMMLLKIIYKSYVGGVVARLIQRTHTCITSPGRMYSRSISKGVGATVFIILSSGEPGQICNQKRKAFCQVRHGRLYSIHPVDPS